jgi:hypothetical protein
MRSSVRVELWAWYQMRSPASLFRNKVNSFHFMNSVIIGHAACRGSGSSKWAWILAAAVTVVKRWGLLKLRLQVAMFHHGTRRSLGLSFCKALSASASLANPKPHGLQVIQVERDISSCRRTFTHERRKYIAFTNFLNMRDMLTIHMLIV